MVRRLKSGQMAPVYLLAIVFVVIDLSARVFSFADGEDYSENVEPFNLHLRPVLDSERYNLIVNAIPSLSSLVSESDQVPTGKVEDSALKEALAGYEKIGEFNYRLIAVFASKQKFAVLERRDDQSPVADTLKVYVGDKIGGLSVKVINSSSMELESEPNSAVLLSLFEPEST